MNKAQTDLIAFAKRHPGKWHSFAMHLPTTEAVCGLANLGLFRVNKYRQFRGVATKITQWERAQ